MHFWRPSDLDVVLTHAWHHAEAQGLEDCLPDLGLELLFGHATSSSTMFRLISTGSPHSIAGSPWRSNASSLIASTVPSRRTALDSASSSSSIIAQVPCLFSEWRKPT